MKNKLFLFFFMICLSANAQDQLKRFDLLILKDGSEFKGKILKYEPSEFVNFQTIHGQEIVFTMDLVEKVLMDQSNDILSDSKPGKYTFKEEKLYLNMELLALMEDDGNGRGFQVGLIYQHSNLVGFGGGVAYHDYEKNTARKVFPIFLTWRSYLLKKNLSPYFNMNVGYGLFFKDEDFGIIDAKGGVFANPQIGIRLGAGEAFCTIAIGAVYQKIETVRDIWGGGTRTDLITFKRSQISLAINF